MRLRREIIALLASLVVACGAPPTTVPGSPAPDASVVVPTLMPAPPQTRAQSPVPKTDRTVWFAPLDMVPRRDTPFWGTYAGSVDYLDLFRDDAAWSSAAARVDVFKFYPQFMGVNTPSDAELRSIARGLARRGISVALEVGVMDNSRCGQGIEGQGNPPETLRVMRRLAAFGAPVRYLAMDEPFYFWSVDTSSNTCRYAPERVAREVDQFIQLIHTEFPDVIIGDIEPDSMSQPEIERWIEAYRTESGHELAFFHWDVAWDRFGWQERAATIERYARARGIPFGMIYNGLLSDGSDLAWLGSAEEHVVRYESSGGRPEHVIFQSWLPYPTRVLPETDPAAFTHLINRFFDARTTLRLQTSSVAMATGQLTETATGSPITGASIDLRAVPLDGRGAPGEYVVTGTVPAGSISGVIGVRINMEGGGPGGAEVALYEMRYREGDSSTDRVRNGRFAAGGLNWGVSDLGAARFEPSELGSGTMLHIKTGPAQSLLINSSNFEVTSGAAFTATFLARVAPSTSGGSGYFTVIFIGPSSELRRETIFLEPQPILSTVQTDDTGRFTYAGPASARFSVTARWRGDARRWPAFASAIP
jgi:hypothetical protein